jgi:prepilin-type N-terminal cleavage/methylation domain-containing protein
MSEEKKMRGFTLVELLVVMAILAVLIALSIAGLGYAMRRSRNVSRLAAVENIVVAMESFYTDNQNYPDTPAAGQTGFRALFGPDQGSGFTLQEYLEGTFDAPPESHFYVLSDGQLYTACVNQETWGGTWDWSCQGTGVGAAGFPVREPTPVDTNILGGAGNCGEWDGEDWIACDPDA